jgi:hypothetical protein
MGEQAYIGTQQETRCVLKSRSAFFFFLQNAGERARTQQERKAMWQPLPCHTIVHEIAHAVNQFLRIEREDNGQNSGEVSKPCLCFLEKSFSVAQPFEEAGFALECLVFGGILNLLGTDHETNVKGLRYGIQITNHLWTSNNYSVWPSKWRTV